MKEADLRKFHRYMGGSIALLVVFQAGTGLMMSLNHLAGSRFLGAVLSAIHFGGGTIGNGYRIALAATLLFMVATGLGILRKIRARSAAASKLAPGPVAKPKEPGDQPR